MFPIKSSVIVFLCACSIYGACEGALDETTKNFHVATDKVSRDRAVQLCKDRSMELVSIRSPEKNEAIFHFLQEKEIVDSLWVSGQRNSDGYTWTWLDGEDIEYFYWGPGPRDNQSCMAVYKKFTNVFWDDKPCEEEYGYICEEIAECDDRKLVSVTVGDEECSMSAGTPIKPKKQFYLGTEKATRAQALQHCSRMFMQLARIHDEEENNALLELMRQKGTSNGYWTAGNKKVGRRWEWLNDEPITYFEWALGEPNIEENVGICLEVSIADDEYASREGSSVLLWKDRHCSDERLFVCESLDTVVEITVKGKLVIPDVTGSDVGAKKCSVVVNTV